MHSFFWYFILIEKDVFTMTKQCSLKLGSVAVKKLLPLAILATLSGCLGSSDSSSTSGDLDGADGVSPDISGSTDVSALSSNLTKLRSDFLAAGTEGVDKASSPANIISASNVILTVTTTVADASVVRARLQALGMTNISQYKHLISGSFPIKDLDKLEGVSGISWVNSSKAATRMSPGGSAYNAADIALFTDVVKKQNNLDGTGITIGVMSDSYNCLAGAQDDILSGDLPNVVVVKEYSYCDTDPQMDEGRAMLQLIHDIAPGAKLLFHTAVESPVDFAQGVQALASAGADIIVDDIGWLAMPMFQEGPIAQAVTDIAEQGVTYFSAAGNNGRLSYEHSFSKTMTSSGDEAHDFGLAAGGDSDIYQKITVPADVELTIVLQWDDPSEISGGAKAITDLDLMLLDADMKTIISSSHDNNIGHDPVEMIRVKSGSFGEGVAEGNLYFRKSAGPDPKHIKYVVFSSAPAELISESRAPAVEQLHLDQSGQFIMADGSVMEGGKSVIVLPGFTGIGSEWLSGSILQIGSGGREIQLRISDGQRGVFINSDFYPIDTPEQAVWFIPDGYLPKLDSNNKIELFAESASEQVQTDVRIAEYATYSSTVYGHPNALGAIAVGAMPYNAAPWFPQGSQLIEPFSSAGGTPIFFNKSGQRLTTPEYRAKPEIISVDDVDTTFFGSANLEATDSDFNGFPNFKGTSAAAPNAAALAAILLQEYPHLLPHQVKKLMMRGTVDLGDPLGTSNNDINLPITNPCADGVVFDWGTGCGLIQAHTIFDDAQANSFLVENLQPDSSEDTVVDGGDTTDTTGGDTGSTPTDGGSSVPSITKLVGDFNGNGCIDTTDNAMLLAALRFGSANSSEFDVSGDGWLDNTDRIIMENLLVSDVSCS